MNCLLMLVYMYAQALCGFAESNLNGKTPEINTSFEKGHYYTYSGLKVTGMIRLKSFAYTPELGTNYILFKSDTSTQKQKLTAADIQSFVIGSDSFTVITSFTSPHQIYYKKDFAKVVVSGSFLSLYLHPHERRANGTEEKLVPLGGIAYTPVNSSAIALSGAESLYYIQKNDSLYCIVKTDFLKQAPRFFGDDPKLMSKINQKKLGFENLELIVEEYNEWKHVTHKNTYAPNEH